MGYVQAHATHLLIAIPFIRVKTSYRRVRGVRSKEFHRLLDLENMHWSERRYLEPYLAETVVVVELSEFPFSRTLLKILFPNQMLNPGVPGYVFIVEDWMSLSLEIDSRHDDFRQYLQRRRRKKEFKLGMYK